MDLAPLYEETRQRLCELVRSLPSAELDTEVPATPGWRVRDVIAHLTGGPGDVLSGNLEGAGGEAWTAAQVAARRGRALDEVLAEWDGYAGGVRGLFETGGPNMGFLLADVASHEQDVRGALRRPGARDCAGIEATTQLFVAGAGRRFTEAGIALRITAGRDEWEVGAGEPQASVVVEPFELFRAFAGRRSPTQVCAWGWTGDPGPYLGLLPIFPLRPTDLVE